MADRGKMVIAQIRHFTNFFLCFLLKRINNKILIIYILVSFKKNTEKYYGKCLICAMTIFPQSAILLRFTLYEILEEENLATKIQKLEEERKKR
jgi:hypothetical protein